MSMPLFLKEFTLKKRYRKIRPFSIQFKPGVNLIVGENGAGKSSMLHLIMGEPDKDLFEIKTEKVGFRFFDTEKENPRTKDPNLSKNFGYGIASRFRSHGEALLPILLTEEFKEIILFVDEPEAGISLSNQIKLFKHFDKVTKNNNCQIILTTHSYVFISKATEVFSLNNKKWVPSGKYLEEILG